MRERFTHACNSNQLIILARKEGNLPRRAAVGDEVEGDSLFLCFSLLGFLVMASSWGLFF
jgi:hypothetical protein